MNVKWRRKFSTNMNHIGGGPQGETLIIWKNYILNFVDEELRY